MLELLDSLTSENLVLICLVLGVIALALAIGISVEMYVSEKKLKEYKQNEIKSNENTQTRLNIKESADVKYVEEDRELEKTRAKIELEELREKLRKEEQEKKRIIEENLALEKEKEEKKEQIEFLEDTIVNMKPIKEEVEPVKEVVIPVKEEDYNSVAKKIEVKEEKPEELEKTKELVINIIDDDKDEEEAIISYEELKNAKNFGYTDEEMYNNADEEGAIISMQELENLYHESQNITVNESNNEVVEQEVKNDNTSTSSIYNYSKTDQDLILEQTANLEKLNEEIRKTNEFLKMLKDLKKNLD